MSLYSELKRRKVVRVVLVYCATAFVVLQAADLMLPRMGVPDWAMSLVVALAVLGLPIALVLAWALELTPDGVRVTPTRPATDPDVPPPPLLERRTVLAAATLVVLGVGLGAGWFLRPIPAGAPEAVPAAGVDPAGPSIAAGSVAVLPFADMSEAGDQAWFEPYLDRGRADIELVVSKRLKAGEPGLAAFYRRISTVPVEGWLRPGDRQWSLAVLAEAAGLPAAAAHADSAIADLSALDRIHVALDAPLAERRAAAFGHAKRGLALAIAGRREQAETDLRRSRALLRPGDDNIDHFTVASFLAHAWAILGNADEFFAELTPYAHGPSHLYARQLTDDPILSRFADDPRHGALIQALRSP